MKIIKKIIIWLPIFGLVISMLDNMFDYYNGKIFDENKPIIIIINVLYNVIIFYASLFYLLLNI